MNKKKKFHKQKRKRDFRVAAKTLGGRDPKTKTAGSTKGKE